jgi:predicted aldo/keto reductase-like oxidoreductase
MDFLEAQKKAGVIRHIGVSSHSLDMAKEMVKSDRFETLLFPFNFITDEAERELLPLCREHDVGFIAMKPLAGGMLDNATLCFKYIFKFPDVVSVPGIEKIAEIEEIVGILNRPLELTKAEEKEMQRLRDELGSSFCHRCDYCRPCTVDIPISTVMISPSFFKRQPADRFFTGNTAAAVEKAADCTQCGECEKRCPYHLHIIDTLAERVKWFREEKAKYEATVIKK